MPVSVLNVVKERHSDAQAGQDSKSEGHRDKRKTLASCCSCCSGGRFVMKRFEPEADLTTRRNDETEEFTRPASWSDGMLLSGPGFVVATCGRQF